MTDNRQHERHELSIDVEVTSGDQSLAGSSKDISIGGMKLEMPRDTDPLRPGMRLEVAFRLPELRDEIRVPALVRWTDRIDPHIGGVQFLRGLRAREVWAIDRMRRD